MKYHISAMVVYYDEIEQIKEEMCDSFCRVPYEAEDEEEATELCKLCPLNRLEVTIND